MSILYKDHISPVAKNEALATSNAVSILYKYHISHGFMKNLFVIHNSSCRSFISIIFPASKSRMQFSKRFKVSILYKYHISQKIVAAHLNKMNLCRSFISIIFPKRRYCSGRYRTSYVSILYKYHISQNKNSQSTQKIQSS